MKTYNEIYARICSLRYQASYIGDPQAKSEIKQLISSMRKVKTVKDILSDSRIERFIKNYDGYGKHMVECKDGYKFEGERTIEIGTIAEICYSINFNLEYYAKSI